MGGVMPYPRNRCFPPKTFCVETMGGEGSKVLVEMLVKMREGTGRRGDG